MLTVAQRVSCALVHLINKYTQCVCANNIVSKKPAAHSCTCSSVSTFIVIFPLFSNPLPLALRIYYKRPRKCTYAVMRLWCTLVCRGANTRKEVDPQGEIRGLRHMVGGWVKEWLELQYDRVAKWHCGTAALWHCGSGSGSCITRRSTPEIHVTNDVPPRTTTTTTKMT